jgi:hypothetical protein
MRIPAGGPAVVTARRPGLPAAVTRAGRPSRRAPSGHGEDVVGVLRGVEAANLFMPEEIAR